MIIRLAVNALLLAVHLGTGSVPAFATPAIQASQTPAVEAAIDSVAQDALARGVTPGLVIGVAQRGQPMVIRAYGFSDLENKVPMRTDSVLRIGSITKQFTAAIVMLLAEEGRLSIDDPLSKFLPDYPRAKDVTLRQMLNHTSGLRNFTDANFGAGPARIDYTTAQFVAYLVALPNTFDFEPGTAWSYSNTGYFLLGAVIEKVTGKSFAAVMKDRIAGPLGLSATVVDDLAEIVPHRVHGYARAPSGKSGFLNAGFASMSAPAAAGAIRSTAADLLSWNAALLGGKLLRPDSVKMMTTPALLKDGRLTSQGRFGMASQFPPGEYGFGLMMDREDGLAKVGHGGSINGFNSMLQTLPDDGITILLLTNADGAAVATMPSLRAAILRARK